MLSASAAICGIAKDWITIQRRDDLLRSFCARYSGLSGCLAPSTVAVDFVSALFLRAKNAATSSGLYRIKRGPISQRVSWPVCS